MAHTTRIATKESKAASMVIYEGQLNGKEYRYKVEMIVKNLNTYS